MLLLVSPINTKEAKEAIEGGADIIDVKNPKEGSLGANFPWVIKSIKEIIPKDKLLSATVGDIDYKPGTVSLAVLGAVTSGADYVKIGLYGTKNYEQALEVMKNAVKTVEYSESEAFVVAAGYGDAKRVNSVDPMEIPNIAADADADVAMLDTAIKDGKCLLDFLNLNELAEFVENSHDHGLKCALAGSLKKEHVKLLHEIGCDIVGIRGAACIGGDRNKGYIHRSAVSELKNIIKGF